MEAVDNFLIFVLYEGIDNYTWTADLNISIWPDCCIIRCSSTHRASGDIYTIVGADSCISRISEHLSIFWNLNFSCRSPDGIKLIYTTIHILFRTCTVHQGITTNTDISLFCLNTSYTCDINLSILAYLNTIAHSINGYIFRCSTIDFRVPTYRNFTLDFDAGQCMHCNRSVSFNYKIILD